MLFALDVGDFLVEPLQPLPVGAHIVLKLMAPGGEVGKNRGQLGELAFGVGERCFSLRDALIDATAFFDAGPDLVL